MSSLDFEINNLHLFNVYASQQYTGELTLDAILQPMEKAMISEEVKKKTKELLGIDPPEVYCFMEPTTSFKEPFVIAAPVSTDTTVSIEKTTLWRFVGESPIRVRGVFDILVSIPSGQVHPGIPCRCDIGIRPVAGCTPVCITWECNATQDTEIIVSDSTH